MSIVKESLILFYESAAHKEDKHTGYTLALPAKSFALCTPISGY